MSHVHIFSQQIVFYTSEITKQKSSDPTTEQIIKDQSLTCEKST